MVRKEYIGTNLEGDMQASNGMLLQMCVLHRLAPSGKDVQSVGVIGGVSVCSEHLDKVADEMIVDNPNGVFAWARKGLF